MLTAGLTLGAGLIICAFWLFPVVKNKCSIGTLSGLLLLVWGISGFLEKYFLGWLAMIVLVDLYLLFYSDDYKNYKAYCLWQLGLFLGIAAGTQLVGGNQYLVQLPVLFLPAMVLLVLWRLAGKRPWFYVSMAALAGVFFYIGCQGFLLPSQLGILLVLIQIRMIYQGFSKSFHHSKEKFQNQIMLHHYEEVKTVYLNMRGWRHDYHNHIQTMKAYLALEQYQQMDCYLGELEQDLNQVDQLVKSGNLMVDAILNSKLTLAEVRGIRVSCKVTIPPHINVTDIDICVILGNLLDNAIEACEKINQHDRFIRIYGDIVHSQFYFSVLNSALLDPSFQQKHYISEKRGEHGHGMKRVRLTVEKYQGLLNLKNEPGVFASELMIPLELS